MTIYDTQQLAPSSPSPHAHSDFDELLADLIHTDATSRHAAFQLLAARVLATGPSPQTAALAERITDRLGAADSALSGELLFLLGLLADRVGDADTASAVQVREAVRRGLGTGLSLLALPGLSERTRVALLYLLAQFPRDRARIPASPGPHIGALEWARLRRCVDELDPDDPVLGRAWPSPAGWVLTPDELEADRAWALSLDRERAEFVWRKDTRTLLAYCGARAYAALRAPLDDETPQDLPVPGPPEASAAEARDIDVNILCCPHCGGSLARQFPVVRCRSCAARYDETPGFLDLSGADESGTDQIAGNSPMYLDRYEPLLRPAFLRVTGANWSEGVTVAQEDEFLARHLPASSGPVLDLAAGAGRWTAVLAGQVGARRLIAMDLATAMVRRLRRVLPDVAALRGSAERIPFADGSLGAVSCWNALQSMADPARVIADVGRCLRPGGVFTLLTFTTSTDPVYRYFQQRHEDCLTVRSFPRDELLAMLDAAGLSPIDERSHESLVMIAAVRRG